MAMYVGNIIGNCRNGDGVKGQVFDNLDVNVIIARTPGNSNYCFANGKASSEMGIMRSPTLPTSAAVV